MASFAFEKLRYHHYEVTSQGEDHQYLDKASDLRSVDRNESGDASLGG